jgi:hypothetical protein
VSDWKIARKGTACAGCGNAFTPGQSFVSAIYLGEGEQFERRDLHLDCFEGADGEPYSRWITTIPEKQERKPLLDLGLAMEFLLRLVKEADAEKHKVALVLALLLLRKRRLKFLGERIDEEAGRVMDLAVPRKPEDEEFTLPAPELEESETDEITAELGRLFGLGGEEADGEEE